MGGGGGKDDAKIQVSLYSMAIHMGVCLAGDGVRLLGIKIGGKWAWKGNRKDEGPITIDRPKLYGGVKKEGGVGGVAYWLPGGEDQVLPNALAKRYGSERGAEIPGYRGVASVFFVGKRSVGTTPETADEWNPTDTDGPRGFYWGANNPYSRPVAFLVESLPGGLNPRYRAIDVPKENIRAANPAHTIYTLIHSEDGAGARYGATDKASYEVCAQTLYEEGFGICGIWTRQSKVEEFVNEILDHINATQFLHPSTGRLTLKLLRDDYDVSTLRRIRPEGAKLINYKRKAWGETANEIVITYTDPRSNKDATITAHDLAAIAAQGEVVSGSRNYHMIRSRKLASAVANREIAQSVRPLAVIELELPRTGWDLIAGEVVVLEGWESDIAANFMVCRVSQVEYREARSNTISVSLYEDIFGEHLTNYLDPVETEWQNPSVEPAPLLQVAMLTAPAMLMALKRGVDDPTDLNEPNAMPIILAKRNSPDDAYYEIVAPVTLPNGAVELREIGTRNYYGTATLATGISAAVRSTVALADIDGPLRTGQFVLIGPSNDFEIALVDAKTETTVTLLRGLLDTVPRTWPDGTMVWFVPDGDAIPESTVRVAGETVTYYLKPTTSLGSLELENTPARTLKIDRRPHQPLRPANVKINGQMFGKVDAGGLTKLTVTWANRNRSYEAPQVFAWDEDGVTPEPGQTTVIRLLTSEGDLISEVNAGTGSSYAIDIDDFGERENALVQVFSKRGTDYSFQGHTLRISNLSHS